MFRVQCENNREFVFGCNTINVKKIKTFSEKKNEKLNQIFSKIWNTIITGEKSSKLFLTKIGTFV